MLRGLTTDRSAAVVTEVIRSAGQTRDPELCAWLLERLGDGRTRREARAALAAYGTGVLEELGRRLADVATPRAIRVQLPRVVAEIGGLPAAELLLARLGDLQPALHLATIKALNRLRVADPTLRFPVDAVERHVLRICGELGALHAQRAALPDVPGDRKVALLGRAVAEKCASLREQALRLLGLCYPPRDMLNAFHGLVGEDRARRAHALEFLDNVLSPRIRAALVPVLEGAPSAARPESPRRLLGSADAWLRACAVANVRVLAPDEVATWVERARADRDPIVRDAAGGA
jgi:AAA family ATP:ADP antiporter